MRCYESLQVVTKVIDGINAEISGNTLRRDGSGGTLVTLDVADCVPLTERTRLDALGRISGL